MGKDQELATGWWFGCHSWNFPMNIGFISSSQLTNSYFSEGWPNHQPGPPSVVFWALSLWSPAAITTCWQDMLLAYSDADFVQRVDKLSRVRASGAVDYTEYHQWTEALIIFCIWKRRELGFLEVACSIHREGILTCLWYFMIFCQGENSACWHVHDIHTDKPQLFPHWDWPLCDGENMWNMYEYVPMLGHGSYSFS